MNQSCVFILPPLLPRAPTLRVAFTQLLGVGDIANWRIKPHVEHFSFGSFHRYRNTPVEVASHRTRLQVHIQPGLTLSIDIRAPLFVSFENPLLQPLLVFVQRKIPVLRLLQYRCGAADSRLRIDQFGRTQVATTFLTLVTVCSFVVAIRTFARHITVGKELFGFLVIELCGRFFCQFPFIVKFLEELRSKLMMGLAGGTGIDIKRDAELLERLFDHRVITVNNILRGDTFLAGTDGDRYSMLIATANEDHIFLLQAQVSDIDVCRHIYASQMTDMNTTVGIGKCRCDGCPFILLLFHRFVYLFLFMPAKLQRISELAQ